MVLIFVRDTRGGNYSLEVSMKWQVSQLKQKLLTMLNEKGATSKEEQMRLIFSGRILKDGDLLESYNIQKECSLQLFITGNRPQVQKLQASLPLLQLNEHEPQSPLSATPALLSPFSFSGSNVLRRNVADHALQLGDLVTVTLKRGKALRKPSLLPGQPDPYVIMSAGEASAKSRIVRASVAPEWHEVFGFRVSGGPSLVPTEQKQVLTLLVFDYEYYTPDVFMGSVDIDVTQLPRGRSVDVAVPLDGQVHATPSICVDPQQLGPHVLEQLAEIDKNENREGGGRVFRDNALRNDDNAGNDAGHYSPKQSAPGTPSSARAGVSRGTLHLTLRRAMITSPAINGIIQSLTKLERSWRALDLAKFSIDMRQLMGEAPWSPPDMLNPALEHLAKYCRSSGCSADLSLQDQQRVRRILLSQRMLPLMGSPSRQLYVSGLRLPVDNGAVALAYFVDNVADIAPLKRITVLRGGKATSQLSSRSSSRASESNVTDSSGIRSHSSDAMQNDATQSGDEAFLEECKNNAFDRLSRASTLEEQAMQAELLQSDSGVECELSPAAQRCVTVIFEFASVADSISALLALQHSLYDPHSHVLHGRGAQADSSLSHLICDFGRHVHWMDDWSRRIAASAFVSVGASSVSAPVRGNGPARWRNAFVVLRSDTSQLEIRTSLAQSEAKETLQITPWTFVCTHGEDCFEVRAGASASDSSALIRDDSENNVVLDDEALGLRRRSFFFRSDDVFCLANLSDAIRQAKWCLRQQMSEALMPSLPLEYSMPMHLSKEECHLCRRQVPPDFLYCTNRHLEKRKKFATRFPEDRVDDEPTCVRCLRLRIFAHLKKGNCADLERDFTVVDLRELLKKDEFDTFLDASLKEHLEKNADRYVSCPSCSMSFEFEVGDVGDEDAPDFNRIVGVDGRTFASDDDVAAQSHFMSHRVLCRNSDCLATFCRQCNVSPYHAGFTCADYKVLQTAARCRFCSVPLLPGKTLCEPARDGTKPPPSRALLKVCNGDECQVKRDACCTATLPCGHPCAGTRGEGAHQHLHCLERECILRIQQRETLEIAAIEECKMQDDLPVCETPVDVPTRCRVSDWIVASEGSDLCAICCTDSLKAAPCTQLACGHVFHHACLRTRLTQAWCTPHISFGFLECPICKSRMWLQQDAETVSIGERSRTTDSNNDDDQSDHSDRSDRSDRSDLKEKRAIDLKSAIGGAAQLQQLLLPLQQLHREIAQRAFRRLESEGLLQCEQVTDKTDSYYRNPTGYAMKRFAFYRCAKCRKPYFGGRQECDDGLARGDNNNADELVCGACSGIGSDACAVHGRENILWKCRFCCSPATFFCWGTTHFCAKCHQRQENHDYMTTKSADELEQCGDAENCPLGVSHPPNGTEFSLGCSLCRGADLSAPRDLDHDQAVAVVDAEPSEDSDLVASRLAHFEHIERQLELSQAAAIERYCSVNDQLHSEDDTDSSDSEMREEEDSEDAEDAEDAKDAENDSKHCEFDFESQLDTFAHFAVHCEAIAPPVYNEEDDRGGNEHLKQLAAVHRKLRRLARRRPDLVSVAA
ncbi:MAG: hypothetical protein MHM6MM_002381 [Cercozoa sp. M6MM]